MFSVQSKIAVFGNDQFAINTIKYILSHGKYRITMIIANSPRQYIDNMPTYTLFEAIRKHRTEFDTILIMEEMPFFDEKYLQLHFYNIGEIYILHKESKEIFDSNHLILESAIQHFDLSQKPLLRYVEFHLVDYCNLNCKGCTHFSNIYHRNDQGSLIDLASIVQQFRRLKSLCDVSIIRLMGGEPLLHPQLERILPLVRNIFPLARIFLVTNGLLIEKLSASVCESIRNNDIFINISLYRPTIAKYNEIEDFLNKNDIIHFWGNGEKCIKDEQIITRFHTCLTTNRKEKSNGYKVCYNKYCWFLRDGKIAKCGYPLLINVLNRNLGSEFKVDERDYIDIDSCTSGWDIVSFLNNPTPFCKYCCENTVEFLWESDRKAAELQDYIVEN